MNEATFESHLNTTLDKIFVGPLRPMISHQKTLTLKLGHHDVLVDGEPKSSTAGRLDVLLLVDDKPLAVLELKRPELPLTSVDEEQAASYARLLHPMPPIYIVSNGDETRLFRTYDRTGIKGDTLDQERIEAQIAAAAGAAAFDAKEAIHFLLGKSPAVFRAVFQRVSEQQLDFVTGEVAELDYPVTKPFGISRDATINLVHALNQNQPVVTLIGDALSGKTNVAADLYCICYEAQDPHLGLAPIYVNCEHLKQGLLQTIANEAARETQVPATPDNVRHWLISGLLVQEDTRPVIVLDSWSDSLSESWGAEFDELLNLADDQTFSLVVVVDSALADRLLKTQRRGQPTTLAIKSVFVKVPRTLNDREFADAAGALQRHNGLSPEWGAHQNTLLRLPYTWRMLAAFNSKQTGMITAVLGSEQLHNLLQNTSLRPELLEDVRDYCEAVLEDETQPYHDSASSPGWLTIRYAKNKLGESCYARLVECGFLRVRGRRNGPTRVSPQIPPLLAAVATSVVRERLEYKIALETPEDATEGFLRDCQRLPYCELVGAATLSSEKVPPETFEVLVNSLIERPPTISEIPRNARFAILVEGHEPIDLSPDLVHDLIEEGERYTFGDTTPYLILSHVLRWVNLEDEGGHEFVLHLVRRVANVRVPLITGDYRDRERLQYAAPISMYSLKGGGSLVDPCNGVIEPITDALRHLAMDAPSAFKTFVNEIIANSESHFPALNRAWKAADTVAKYNTPVSEKALQWSEALGKAIQDRMLDELGTDEYTD